MNPPPRKSVLGLDVGGANLKASDGAGFAHSVYFPLWRTPEKLSEALVELVAEAPPCGTWAVTMTGELADCFHNKQDGVATILYDVEVAAARQPSPPKIAVYLTDGSFVPLRQAYERYREAAASNWHATASLVARTKINLRGVLIDVGSTTCDIIPFAAGAPTTLGYTDTQRLAAGELVYTGVVRSPVCAVTPKFPWRGRQCPTAQELFATTYDAHLILGHLPEDLGDHNTADGRPATIELACLRLARSICADQEEFDAVDARVAAEAIHAAQVRLIAAGWSQVVARERPEVVVVAGQGEFLARAMLKHVGWSGPIESLAERFGAAASQVGPAYALAILAGERG
ncbi:MAG: H4MPT-linked C1 transfer pathway protein [Planctomycetes bacterium]|nr:H4MPT-linked C1 transfer pathway protein [Planctomycetota bacterium]